MKRYDMIGIWMPNRFAGWRILLDGQTWCVCEEYNDAEREFFTLGKLVRAGKI